MTRLGHVMWRCIRDMESLLETIPGAVVSRYLSREALQQPNVVEVGIQQSEFCLFDGEVLFHVQPEARGPAGIDEIVLSELKDGKFMTLVMPGAQLGNELLVMPIMLFSICLPFLVSNSHLVFQALGEVFSSRVGKELSDEQIRAVAKDLKENWMDLAECLCIPDDAIDELSERGTTATVPRRMLKKFCELMPESAKVCILCDALYEADLQSVADKHFNPDWYSDRILRPLPPRLSTVEECT